MSRAICGLGSRDHISPLPRSQCGRLLGLRNTKPIGLCGACNITMTSEKPLEDEVNPTMKTLLRKEKLCGEVGVGLPKRSRNWKRIGDGRLVFCTDATRSVLQVVKNDLAIGLSNEDFPELKEILHYVRENPMPLFSPSDNCFYSGDYPAWSPPPAPLNTNVDMKWGLSTDRTSDESIPGGYFRSLMSGTTNRVEVARLWDLPALRRLGVCLWDRWRTYCWVDAITDEKGSHPRWRFYGKTCYSTTLSSAD